MPTSLGPAEILVILVVALIVLGPKKLPEAGRQVGKTIAEIRKWSQGFQDEIRSAIDPDLAPPYPPTMPAETSPAADAPADPDPADTGPASTNGHQPGPLSFDPAATDPPGPPAGDPPRT